MSGLIEQALLTPYMTRSTDQSTSIRGVNIKLHSSSLITKGVKSLSTIKPTLFRSIFISPDEGLLYEVETSWGNFFASFNADDQSISYVSNVSNRVKICSDFLCHEERCHRKDVTNMTSHWNFVFADTNNLWLAVYFISFSILQTHVFHKPWSRTILVVRFKMKTKETNWNNIV